MGEERCTYDIGSSISSDDTAPLLFFYVQLHKAIRRELSGLSESVVSLETGYAKMGKTKAEELLLHLKKRYRFLEQVYKYHSSIEDEVGIFGCVVLAEALRVEPGEAEICGRVVIVRFAL
jgi:hypothetical protein